MSDDTNEYICETCGDSMTPGERTCDCGDGRQVVDEPISEDYPSLGNWRGDVQCRVCGGTRELPLKTPRR